jgi:hypothetical protein
MKLLGQQFVMGETIDAAVKRADKDKSELASFDMLGEAARSSATMSDSLRRARVRTAARSGLWIMAFKYHIAISRSDLFGPLSYMI